MSCPSILLKPERLIYLFETERSVSCSGEKLHPIWAGENGPELPCLQALDVLGPWVHFCRAAGHHSVFLTPKLATVLIALCGVPNFPVGLVL